MIVTFRVNKSYTINIILSYRPMSNNYNIVIDEFNN